jgi:hypothetical protein
MWLLNMWGKGIIGKGVVMFPSSLLHELQKGAWRKVPLTSSATAGTSIICKAACSLTDGIAIVATNISDSFAAHFSAEFLIRQLRHRLPALEIEPIDALRLVQRAFESERDSSSNVRFERDTGKLTCWVTSVVEVCVSSSRSQIVVKLSFDCLPVSLSKHGEFLHDFVITPLACVAHRAAELCSRHLPKEIVAGFSDFVNDAKSSDSTLEKLIPLSKLTAACIETKPDPLDVVPVSPLIQKNDTSLGGDGAPAAPFPHDVKRDPVAEKAKKVRKVLR